jgi:hypothetical protein
MLIVLFVELTSGLLEKFLVLRIWFGILIWIFEGSNLDKNNLRVLILIFLNNFFSKNHKLIVNGKQID